MISVRRDSADETAVAIDEWPRLLLVNGLVDTESLSDYERRGGYRALRHVLNAGPDQVIKALEDAGLRGRGGAGFPTHRKWQMVRDAMPGPRYVICNGGEHEPGSFKDRRLMEHYPHAVLEGLLIAAFVVGAERAFVYLTEEQTQALSNLRRAIAELSACGYPQRLNQAFRCLPECVVGPSTYVSGEETAIIGAIEGGEAKPRRKPPYPSVQGVFCAPTLINNAETLALVGCIVDRGAAFFRRMGTIDSPGTVLVTLTNGVNRPGVYEVPYGTSLRSIIEFCGGGTIEGRAVKSILPGGPSLPFLPGDAIDTPFDHRSLKAVGSGVGCGAIRIWLEGENMVEPTLEIARFFAREQCGQCPPCRMQTATFVKALEQVVAGAGCDRQMQQVEKVVDFARGKGGLCSLIPMSAAPVMSAYRLFPSDFRELARHDHNH